MSDTIKGTDILKPTIENKGTYFLVIGHTLRALIKAGTDYSTRYQYVDECNSRLPQEILQVTEQYVHVTDKEKDIDYNGI